MHQEKITDSEWFLKAEQIFDKLKQINDQKQALQGDLAQAEQEAEDLAARLATRQAEIERFKTAITEANQAWEENRLELKRLAGD